MKTNFRHLLMTIGFSAVLGSSLLQAQSARANAEIPFGFYVRDAALPAGSYTVEEFKAGGTVQILNNVTGKSILVMATADRTGHPDQLKLVFHQYGERYFLSEMWLGNNAVDCVSTGKLEREVNSAPAAIATVAMR